MNRQITIIRGLNFMYYAFHSVLTPLLPLYLAKKGYSSAEIGFFLMAGPFAAMFVQPVWGYLSDRFRSLKAIIYLLYGLTFLSSIGLFLANGYIPIFLFTALLFFFYGPASPLLDSLSVKTAAESGSPYGTIRLFGSLGFFAFAIISASLLPLVGGVDNFRYIYWGMWVIPFVLLLFLRDKAGEGPALTMASMKSLAANREFLWFLFMIFIISTPHRMHDALFGYYHQTMGASPGMVSFGWALVGICEVPVFIWLNRYLNRFHELAMLGVISLLYVLRWSLYIVVKDPTALMYLQLTHAFTYAPFLLVAIQYVVRLVPEHLRSTGMSLYASVFTGLAGLAGGVIGGWFEERWAGPGMYGFAAAMSLLAAILFLGTRFYTRSREA
ncbi:MFS transporter [Gorillibacterium massiliense]|uniref:MFS transporter n=1 Tax=Gorillibacterium massiliense TaxID=1280390 RepID=UPI0005954D71|nr:MFS transporter [Gorillibacterium massiliense]